MRLISPESNKLVHEFNSSLTEDSLITCLGWGVNYPHQNRGKEYDSSAGQDIQSVVEKAVHAHTASNDVPDLPKELALLDLEGALPKLSLLPASKE